MKRCSDEWNVGALSVLALVLVGVGGYGLARGYGAFGDVSGAAPVLSDGARDLVARNAGWFWPAAAVVAVLVAWLAARWILAEVAPPTPSTLPLPTDGPGRTELSADAAAAALGRDIVAYPGVRAARARITAEPPDAAVEITLDVADDIDLAALRRRVDEHAVARFRTALDVPDLRARLHVRLVD